MLILSKTIQKADFGILSDKGLAILAEYIKNWESIEFFKFEESKLPGESFQKQRKCSFINAVKSNNKIKKCEVIPADENSKE